MQFQYDIDPVTKRIVKMTWIAHSGPDELFMTELRNASKVAAAADESFTLQLSFRRRNTTLTFNGRDTGDGTHKDS